MSGVRRIAIAALLAGGVGGAAAADAVRDCQSTTLPPTSVIAACSDLIAQIPERTDLADVYFRRARAWKAERQLEQAIADYDEAIRRSPRDSYFHNSRGIALAMAKKYEAAMAAVTEAIRLDPRIADYHATRALVWHLQGEFARAIPDYTRAIGLDPDFSDAYCGRGDAYQELGEKDRAIADYRAARARAKTDDDRKCAVDGLKALGAS